MTRNLFFKTRISAHIPPPLLTKHNTHKTKPHYFGAKHDQLITNLTYNELIMKIV